jgi:hypothetical protein
LPTFSPPPHLHPYLHSDLLPFSTSPLFSFSFLSFPSAPSFHPLRHYSPATPSHTQKTLYVTGTAMLTSDPHSCVCLIM